MKKISLMGMSFLLVIGMSSCGNSQGNDSNTTEQVSTSIAKNINTAEFQEMMKSKEAVVLDVRTPEEVAAGAIEGSTPLDFYGANFKQSLEAMDKNKLVLVYCAVGGRSGNAMKMMQKMGFKEVYNLSGGIRAWKSEGKPVK